MAYSKSNNSKHVRALQFEIFPNEEQKLLIEKTFGCCRKVYNLIIADKLAYYEKYNIDKDFTPAPYKKIYPYLKSQIAPLLPMYNNTLIEHLHSGSKIKKINQRKTKAVSLDLRRRVNAVQVIPQVLLTTILNL